MLCSRGLWGLSLSSTPYRLAASMRTRKSGKIVNISSTAGHETSGRPLYSTAKAGVNHFTKTLAQQMREFNVRPNV